MDIRSLTAADAYRDIDQLAEILADCVAGGAGVGFVLPFSVADARTWWTTLIPAVERGELVLFGAFVDGQLAGTVHLRPATAANQLHRADIGKMLVHSRARRLGLGAALMQAAEDEARRRGKTLLTLDTVPQSAARRLYERLGWQLAGIIPGYALSPSGTLDDTAVMYKPL